MDGKGYKIDHHVIPTSGGKFSVWWRGSVIEDGELVWKDGGYISCHKTERIAQMKADRLNWICSDD